MTRKEAATIAGKAYGSRAKKEALVKYYENPNYCLHCQKVIKVREEEKPSQTRKKKFCGHECAASYNNRNRKRNAWGKIVDVCGYCGQEVLLRPRSDRKNSYRRVKYCDECRTTVARLKRSKLGVLIENQTKDEVFNSSRTPWHARNAITSHARMVYLKSDKPKRCIKCDYKRHFEVCHIKDVSSFSGDTLISVINHLDNLVALCPTHHWELDNGYLVL
jgi:hypothetical protein